MKTEINYDKIYMNRESPEPLHIQLKRSLVREIRSLPPNRSFSLMSERELAQYLKLSRPTTHRAYVELMNDGLVRKRADKSLEVCSDARCKITGSYRVIGVLLPMDFPEFVDNNNRSAIPYLKGIIGRCSALNISCMMLRPPAMGAEPEEVEAFAEEHFGRLYGVIHLGELYPDNREDHVLEQLMRHSEIPQICISGSSSYPHIGSVYANPLTGLSALCNTLKKRGFRHAGVIGKKFSKASSLFNYIASHRNRQMREVLERNGLQCCCVKEFDIEDYEDRLLEFLRSKDRPEMLLCHDDWIARDVMRLAAQAGISIPGDLALAGYDRREDDSFLASIFSYPQKVAETAVDMIVDHFENGISDKNRIRLLSTDFCDGESLSVPNRK